MLEFQKTVLIPGDEVTRINKDLVTEMTEPMPPGEVMHSVQEQLTDGVQLRVVVKSREADTPTLEVYLLNDEGEELRHEHGWSPPFDQDYDFEYDNALYRLTIERGAVITLTAALQDVYLRRGSVICPYCECNDISSGIIQADADTASAEVSCCSCNAVWKDLYGIVSIEPVSPPTQNIMPDHS